MYYTIKISSTFQLLSQLRGNPHVEASFLDPQSFTQVRVSGTVAEIADLDFKKKIVETPGREFLKPLVAAHGFDIFTVFRIEHCRAPIWTMQTNASYPKPEIVF